MPYARGYNRRRRAGGHRYYTRGKTVQSKPRYYRTKVTRSPLQDQLSTYFNPFSTRTTNPKIPDGKCHLSSGLRLQSVTEFINDATGTMDFLLIPGLKTGALVTNTTSATGNMNYTNHADMGGAGDLVQGSGVGEPPVNKWRIVSQAIKFTLVNNSDENDGWWEAIRVSVANNTTAFAADANGFYTSASGLPGVDETSTSLVEHPSYITGKLRDIHRFHFQLKPHTDDHDFVTLPRTIPQATYEVGATSPLIDESMDAIYIRIHGRAGAETPTRVMAHIVSNQEVIYDESSHFSRFMSETTHGGERLMKRQQTMGSVKAAKKMRTSMS